jgi:hypothetical protein
MVAKSASRPIEIGPKPSRIRYSRPRALPSPVEPTLGQTVMIVASATDGGTTPATGDNEL